MARCYCILVFFFFFLVTRGVRASLRAPQLIPGSTEHPASPAVLIALVIAQASARDVPIDAGLNDQKNFIAYGGVGGFAGVGGLPNLGGVAGGLGGLGGVGGLGGDSGSGGALGGGVGGGVGVGGGLGGGSGDCADGDAGSLFHP
ncbi:hypothetical protein BDE02_02G226400 [Populus trichocarpa]|nr:hypothetical protein BDE02_02G226400 [Populus trichocarpa]